jgi:thioredoxin reductase (NADPH)
MNENKAIHDAIIIGAGPAGLTAAIYLGRFRRRCIVLEDGNSRARWIPRSHNIPGFLSGIGGNDFLTTLNDQAIKYGANIQQARVTGLALEDEVFTVSTDHEKLRSRFVLLATGVRDRLPDIADASEAVLRSLLRVCPICDAFEAIDKRIAVIGDGPLGEREADFLKNYSGRVTLLHTGAAYAVPARAQIEESGFERIFIKLSELRIDKSRVTLSTPTGLREFDVLYLALGCKPQHDLARALGAECDENGALQVDAHQQTSVQGLYAAGDLVRGLNQVVVAAAESAIAATAIHNQLRMH